MIAQEEVAHKFILETFARTGRSPTIEEIRREFGMPSVSEAELLVQALERRGSIHRNPGDQEVSHAYPFSNEPTLHRVRLAGGPEVYAMCAIDALGMPFMLKRNADVGSACAQCGGHIRIQIKSEQIVERSPDEIVVWLADRKEGCVAAVDLCPDLNFFCSPRHLEEWKVKRPEQSGQMLTLDQALQGGRQTFEKLLQAQSSCCP